MLLLLSFAVDCLSVAMSAMGSLAVSLVSGKSALTGLSASGAGIMFSGWSLLGWEADLRLVIRYARRAVVIRPSDGRVVNRTTKLWVDYKCAVLDL